EDGIRYDLVTGVQTCALPIFLFLLTITTFVLFRAGLVVVALFVLLDGLVFVFVLVLVFLVRFGLVLFFLGLAGSCVIAVLCVNADGPCYQQQDDRHTYGSQCFHCSPPKVWTRCGEKELSLPLCNLFG